MADRDEEFIARLSESERTFGAWLASKLDEDDWNKAEPMMLAALRAAREEARPKWKTIDTAPRDGTEIQVCGEDGVVQNAYWESCVWFKGWCCGGHRSDMYGPTCLPTHWLPKATPPGDDK